MEQLRQDGIELQHLDLGGGLGVRYSGETPPHPTEYASALLAKFKQYPELEIILEPGEPSVPMPVFGDQSRIFKIKRRF